MQLGTHRQMKILNVSLKGMIKKNIREYYEGLHDLATAGKNENVRFSALNTLLRIGGQVSEAEAPVEIVKLPDTLVERFIHMKNVVDEDRSH